MNGPSTALAVYPRRRVSARVGFDLLVLLGGVCLVGGCSRSPEAEFVTSVPWGLLRPTVVLDSHTHTLFSDGALAPQALAAMAVSNGCTALAITDRRSPGNGRDP